jgi:hypothetical protein
VPISKRRNSLEQEIEREWKSVLCPEWKGRTWIMCEWEIVSEKGRILKRTLEQIDCRCPHLMEFGGADCHWECAGVIGKRERG